MGDMDTADRFRQLLLSNLNSIKKLHKSTITGEGKTPFKAERDAIKSLQRLKRNFSNIEITRVIEPSDWAQFSYCNDIYIVEIDFEYYEK